MSLTLAEVYECIDNLHCDDRDMVIRCNGNGYSIAPSDESGCVEDIGSSFEVPEHVGERGIDSFTAGPWTAYLYHPSIVAPNRNNYDDHLHDLAAGDVQAVIVGVTAVDEHWEFGIQVKE